MFVPQGYSKKRMWPLAIGFHGAGERAEPFRDAVVAILGREHFIVACPEAPSKQHLQSDGSILAGNDWDRNTSDELAYFILSDLLSGYRMDLNRVLLLGAASGGEQCFAVTLKHPGFFRGTVVLRAEMPSWAGDFLSGAEGASFLLFRARPKGDGQALSSRTTGILREHGASVAEGSTPLMEDSIPLDISTEILDWWDSLQ